VSAGGKVLLLGSDLGQVTSLHLAEHLADIPDKRVVKRPLDVMHDDGSVESVMIEEFDTSNPVASSMPEKVFASIVGSFLVTGAASSGRVGRALSYLLSAKELVSFAVSVIERDYGRSL
jgi:aminoglycoside 3-N-acetyltransferase